MPKDSYTLLLNYSFRLLGRKDYSEAEMLKKLQTRSKKVFAPAGSSAGHGTSVPDRLHSRLGDDMTEIEGLVARVMQRLTQLELIDDGKILKNYFQYRIEAKPQGKFKYMQEMRRRGIHKDKAMEAWEKNNVDEKSLALRLIESKKSRFEKLPTLQRKKKMASLLASRGFAGEVIWNILEKI